MSEESQKNISKLMKCLIKQSSLMLENFKNKEPNAYNKPSSTQGNLKKGFISNENNNNNTFKTEMAANDYLKFKESNQVNTGYHIPNSKFQKWNHQYLQKESNQQMEQVMIPDNNDNNVTQNRNQDLESFNLRRPQLENRFIISQIKSQNESQITQNHPNVDEQKLMKPSQVGNLHIKLQQKFHAQKLNEEERIQRLHEINQEIVQDQLKHRLIKIADEKKVNKIFTNRIRPQEQEQNNQSSSQQKSSIKISLKSLSNSSSMKKLQSMRKTQSKNSLHLYDFNNNNNNINNNQSSYQSNNSTNKGTYNFKTTSKNCLEIMKQALEKRQQIYEQNIPYYTQAMQDVQTQISSKDSNIAEFFQSKKRLQQYSTLSIQYQRENEKQNEQKNSEQKRPQSTYNGNKLLAKQNGGSLSSQQLMLVKSQSGKTLPQNQYIPLSNLSSTFQRSNSIQQSYQNQLNTSPSILEENGNINNIRYDDSKGQSPHSSQYINQSEQISRIKKLHKNVLEQNNQNHLKQFFTPLKSNFVNNHNSNSINLTNLFKNTSNNLIHQKNKSEVLPKKQMTLKNGDQDKDEEFYGPWDYQQADSNIFGSFNRLTDRSENDQF